LGLAALLDEGRAAIASWNKKSSALRMRASRREGNVINEVKLREILYADEWNVGSGARGGTAAAAWPVIDFHSATTSSSQESKKQKWDQEWDQLNGST
jgi:hypothetical protein